MVIAVEIVKIIESTFFNVVEKSLFALLGFVVRHQFVVRWAYSYFALPNFFRIQCTKLIKIVCFLRSYSKNKKGAF